MGHRSSARLAPWAVAALVAGFFVIAPSAAAAEKERRSQPIVIQGDGNFTAANGVRSGRGTKANPYVIAGWSVSRVSISDTSAYLVITDNDITGTLTLNWNGDRVTVVDNQIGDLRVNQNVRRTGGPTSGLIARNRIGVVGQLRHFDGVFTKNVVGQPGGSFPFFTRRAVNFDGFHGARFFDNTLYGYLEVRLHGHHHGSSYGAQSHYHGAGHGTHSDHGAVDHTTRYHQVFVYDNTIHADGRHALIYTDSAHSANDRTAASETNEDLNKPHSHFTKVHLTGNKLIGAGLVVDIFNARDQRHTGTNRGLVRIVDNDISVTRPTDAMPYQTYDGIRVRSAQDLDLRIVGNSVAYEPRGDVLDATDAVNRDSGIALSVLDKADVLISSNSVAGLFYGVSASQMTETVQWTIVDLRTSGVEEPVAYDSSVRNPPRQRP